MQMRTSAFLVAVFLMTLLGCTQDNSANVTVDLTLRAPTSITTNRTGLTAVRINWTDNNDVEEGYVVERQTGQGQFVQQVFTTKDVATAIDSLGLAVNETYSYRVRAIRYSERGEYSPVATIKLTLPYP
jgi:hypothetical protein